MLIRVMTFNIRFDTVMDEPAGNRWADRAESVVETVRRCAPDVVGFQEVLQPQLDDLTRALDGYRAVGKPRQAGDTGEHVPLFFDRGRFDAEDFGDFWLSDTPDVQGSLGWDASDPRHCTWALLVDRESHQRFAVFNTHLDVRGAQARIEGARLILNRTKVTPRTPFVVMGDFNSGEDSEPLEAFRAMGLVDTFRAVHPHAMDVGTFHTYTLPSTSEKLDFIMADPSWQTIHAAIVRDEAAGRLPSDHFPVIADLRLRTGAEPTAAEEEATARAVAQLRDADADADAADA